MQNSKSYLIKHQILPRISFKNGEAHTVKLIQDKEDQIEDNTGTIKKGIKYKVVENGEVKTFFTSSIFLIQKLAGCPEETEVVIQMLSKKGSDGKWKSFYKVSKVGDKTDDIPVIEEADYEGEQGVSPEGNSF